MPQQRMDIRMIKDILRLKYSATLSHEAISRSLDISKGVVAKYLALAGAAGLDWASVADLDEAGLERRLLGRIGHGVKGTGSSLESEPLARPGASLTDERLPYAARTSSRRSGWRSSTRSSFTSASDGLALPFS